MDRNAIYFISDAHLGAPFADAAVWEQRLIGFLRSIASDAQSLIILGDLFDFWIEYPSGIRTDYFPVVHELRSLIDHGVEVHYFAGNHDFALGPFITTTLGMTVHLGHDELVLQGKRVHLYHGDGLIKSDYGYRVLKTILRNPVNQALYKLLPPRIGIGLAAATSGTSRVATEKRLSEKILNEYRSHAVELLDKGNDIVFFGHTHFCELSRWGEKTYCNTGAWMRTFDYATMREGRVSLWRYRGAGESPVETAPVDRKQGTSAS